MSEITHRTVKSNGINMHVAQAGAGPVVLLLHGFPELWYSWRHQLPALAEAGYHAVAPDVRGYGQSDAPQAIDAYTMQQHVADATGILDALGAETAVVVGHDWGAPMAWNCAVLAPERFRAVAALSVPFLQRAPAPPMQLFRSAFSEQFFYMLYFQEPGMAEAELEADVRRTMRLIITAWGGEGPPGAGHVGKKKGAGLLEGIPEPERLPPWLTEADLDYYTAEFERTGFRGGLNRYRNMDRDWEQLPQLAGAKVQQPALFMAGELDGVIRMSNPEAMRANVPNLRDLIILPGCGHWTQQERPAEVNAALAKFLKGLPPA